MSKERAVACSLQVSGTRPQDHLDVESKFGCSFQLVCSFQCPERQNLSWPEHRLELFLECPRWRFRKRPNTSLDEQVRALQADKAMLTNVFVDMFVILQRDLLAGASQTGAADIQRLRAQSRERALRLRSALALKDDPMKVDGFAKIRGLLGKYAEKNEDPTEFLRRSREED